MILEIKSHRVRFPRLSRAVNAGKCYKERQIYTKIMYALKQTNRSLGEECHHKLMKRDIYTFS
jgi:hypothetical protein